MEGGSQGDSAALRGHSLTNPTIEFGVFHGIFIIPKRSQSQNCQGDVFCFCFKKRWDAQQPKESGSQSERDVPNGWIQIDDIRPTVDGRNPAVRLLGRVIINKFYKSWIMFG